MKLEPKLTSQISNFALSLHLISPLFFSDSCAFSVSLSSSFSTSPISFFSPPIVLFILLFTCLPTLDSDIKRS